MQSYYMSNLYYQLDFIEKNENAPLVKKSTIVLNMLIIVCLPEVQVKIDTEYR